MTSKADIPPRDRRTLPEGQSLVLLAVLAVLCVGLSVGSAQFLSVENLIAIARQCALVLIVACGMTMLLIAAEVDLSVGASLAFCGVVAMDVTNQTHSVALGALAGIAFGGAVGLVNGLVVTKARVNSLIATIAMLMVLQGGVFLYSREAVQNTHRLPGFTWLSTGYVGPLPVPVLFALVVLAVAAVMLARTVFGRTVYAVGANPVAARLSGIRPHRVKLVLFIATGLLTGLAGVVLASLMNAGQPTSGRGFELTVVAAVILGGTALTGGRGTLLGTALGVLILKVIDNGIIILQWDQNLQMIVPGVVIILATWLDLVRRRHG
jgi:ribose transport system permease protein